MMHADYVRLAISIVNVIKQLAYALSCGSSKYDALGKFVEHIHVRRKSCLAAFRNNYTKLGNNYTKLRTNRKGLLLANLT